MRFVLSRQLESHLEMGSVNGLSANLRWEFLKTATCLSRSVRHALESWLQKLMDTSEAVVVMGGQVVNVN